MNSGRRTKTGRREKKKKKLAGHLKVDEAAHRALAYLAGKIVANFLLSLSLWRRGSASRKRTAFGSRFQLLLPRSFAGAAAAAASAAPNGDGRRTELFFFSFSFFVEKKEKEKSSRRASNNSSNASRLCAALGLRLASCLQAGREEAKPVDRPQKLSHSLLESSRRQPLDVVACETQRPLHDDDAAHTDRYTCRQRK